MNARHLQVALLFTIVGCNYLSVSAGNPSTALRRLPRSRLLRRRDGQGEKKRVIRRANENKIVEKGSIFNVLDNHARKLPTDDDFSFKTILSLASEPPSCISVIAVDEYRLLSRESSGIRGKNNTSNARFSYDDTSRATTDERFLCQLSSGPIAPIQGTDEQIAEMRTMLNSGLLISAESNVEVEVEVPIVTAGEIDASSSIDDVVVTLPSGGIKLIDNTGNASARRRLGKFEGDKRVLLVRVTDVDGRSVPEDAETISDKFFGTYGDTMTVKSGFAACSFDKFRITYDYGTTEYDYLLSAPGVLDVTIDIALTTSSQTAILQAAANAAMQKMEVAFPGPFAHVIFVLKDCYTDDAECDFAAYGYVNHWVLVTIGDNWKYPAVIMHEMGHNLNLGHSGGLDGGSYTDHTCLMGNPLFSDDVGRMCFNAVKNYQIAKGAGGWYTDDTDIAFFNSGTSGGTSWRGNIIGVADYGYNPSNFPIILKLETGGGSDYFVSFNRATGVNSEVQEASNRVTLHRVDDGDGMSYSQSTLIATLYDGQSATVENWRKSGIDLTIKVIDINVASSPGYADVMIIFGSQTITTTSSTITTTTTSSTIKSSSPAADATFDSGTTSSTSWSGYIAEENSGLFNFPTKVNLSTGGSISGELYFMYEDGVVNLLHSSGDVRVMASIAKGEKEIISNWRYSGYELLIEVGDHYNDKLASLSLQFRP